MRRFIKSDLFKLIFTFTNAVIVIVSFYIIMHNFEMWSKLDYKNWYYTLALIGVISILNFFFGFSILLLKGMDLSEYKIKISNRVLKNVSISIVIAFALVLVTLTVLSKFVLMDKVILIVLTCLLGVHYTKKINN